MEERRPLLVRRLRRGHWVALDVAAAVLLTAAFIVSALADGRAQAVPVIAAALLPLSVRRVWPVPVLGVTLAATVASPALGWGEPYVAVAVAAHAVALLEPRRTATAGLLAALGGIMAAFALAGQPWPQVVSATSFGWLLTGLAWTVGLATREQRAHAAKAAAHAARRAIEEERLRIARDLHDVVAHSMSVISVRAAIANHVAGTRPEEAGEALTLIEGVSRSALADMRHLLGLLRRDADRGPARGPADLASLPGLAAQAGALIV